MATDSRIYGVTNANISKSGRDTVTIRYRVKFDAVQLDPYEAYRLASLATPEPVPALRTAFTGALLPIGNAALFLDSVVPNIIDEAKTIYDFDLTYTTPEPNAQAPQQQDPNPTQRPGQRNIEYIASEYVVKEAKNVEALAHGKGEASRAANTLGPIVNAAGSRPDEPIVDTEYNGVLVFTRNYATLGEIDGLNQTYQRTTNKSKVYGYDPRRLKYLVTESLGQQFEGDIEYWPGQTRVEIKKTTDLILDNVGYDVWDDEAGPDNAFGLAVGAVVRYKPKDGEYPGEPVNLKMDGTFNPGDSTQITYRHLEEKEYGPLFGIPQ